MALLRLGKARRKALLFVNSADAAVRLRLFLEKFGVRAASLHGALFLFASRGAWCGRVYAKKAGRSGVGPPSSEHALRTVCIVFHLILRELQKPGGAH